MSAKSGRRCLGFTLVLFFLGLSAGAAWPAAAGDGPFAHRWFFVSRGLDSDQAVEKVCGLVDMAAAHGFTGMVYDPGFTSIAEWSPDAFPRLAKVKAHCDEKKIEIIPLVMSAGYGSSVVSVDRNLAEGLPVKGEQYVVEGGVAKLVPDVAFSAAGGFDAKGDEVRGLDAQDKPGTLTFIDTKEVKVGKASLRMEPVQNGGKVRLTKSLTKPERRYLVRFWAKAEGLKPSRIEICVYNESFQIEVIDFRLPESGEWTKIEFPVLTAENKETKVFIGTWNAKAGKFWIDGLEIAEQGPFNILRRPGTPLVIAREGGGEVFQEGKDYEKLVDSALKPNQAYHPAPTIKIIPGGKIKDGDHLSVSYFAPPFLRKNQVVICMSEPKVFDIWGKAVRKVEETLHPQTWFLDMDEIRGGGTCQACLDRKRPDGARLTPGEILGDCVTRQVAMIREGSPKAEVAIWQDMFDPNHNAGPEFFNVPGGYVGSWKFVPKDLIMVCWNDELIGKSLAHFSGLGFRTLAGAYYDADNLDSTKKWVAALPKTPKATGIMYTTWEENFKLLPEFGDLVTKSAK